MKTEDYKKIIARRDPRFDGRFYFGVKTTKIYCRPVCPAKPKPENIVIFKSQSEAEKSGYRPCKRCHPDSAPGSTLLTGTGSSISRALRLIEYDTDFSVTKLADTLGMTDRHLRRLFDEHLGASPIEIILTNKLHLAKKLITQTDRSISEIAFAVGFNSLRRFNEAFKEAYQAPPTELRKNKTRTERDEIVLELPVRTPYDWKSMIAYLDRHTSFGREIVTNNAYVRYLTKGSLTVSFEKDHLVLKLKNVPLSEIRLLTMKVKQLFDVDHNPHHLPASARGIRIPGAFDTFETAVSIILGQLISTEQAKQKVKALIVKYGERIEDDVYAFPTPEKLIKSEIEEIGITKVKANAIRELSRLVMEGELDLSPSADLTEMRKKLIAIKGVGPWTVEIIAMRCLGDSDAFPKTDLAIARATYKEANWSTFRGYLTHVLWRDYMKTKDKK